MAQTDLVSQKILGTDPQVGFGESAVLPYRQRQFESSGYDAMERAQTRKEAQAAELSKTNAHFFNERIGKLKESDRMFNGLINQKTKEVVEVGTSVVRANKGQLTGDENFNQKYAERNALADGTMQLRKDYDAVLKADYGDYVSKEDVIGAATRNLEKAALDADAGDISAVSRNIKPNENSFEFFKVDKFIYDKVKDIKMSEQSTDDRGSSGLGEYITTTSNGYKFATKDANGNLVEGVDKSIVNYFLNPKTTDPDMLRFQASVGNQANLEIENKALKILQDDPRYKNLKEDQVPEQLNKLKDQIAYGQGSEFYEGVDAIKERMVREKLDPFQERKEKIEIKSGHKYPAKDGSGGNTVSSPEGIFIKTLAGLQQQTPEFVAGLKESTTTNDNGVPYLDATTLFNGIKTGESSKGKAEDPHSIFIDPEKPGTIFIQQRQGGEIVPMSDAAISQFAVRVGNIKGNNLNYKTMLQEGNKLGVFGPNNQFIGKNAATPDSEFNKEQEDLSKSVASEVVNRKGKLTEAIGKNKKSWITDWNRGEVDKIQDDINANVLKGTTLIDKEGNAHQNPTVKIDRGLLGGVTYVITDSDNETIELTEEEFQAISEGKSDASGKLIIGRDAVKGKPSSKKTIEGF